MPRIAIVLLLVTLLWPPPLRAQFPADSLVRRRLDGGITLLLPVTWRTVGDSTQRRIASILDTSLGNSRDTLLRASLRMGRPVTLLPATIGEWPDLSVNLNVAPAPGSGAQAFGSAPAADVIAALAPVCNVMRGVYERLGARLITCGPAALDQAAGRTVAVTRLVHSGPRGFVTVWLVQYPDRDVIYTFTLQTPQDAEARYEPLLRKLWRSVEIPAP
jgi:hypothetical protein